MFGQLPHDRVSHGQLWVDGVRLVEHADGDITADGDLPGIGFQLPHEQFHEGGFPITVATDNETTDEPDDDDQPSSSGTPGETPGDQHTGSATGATAGDHTTTFSDINDLKTPPNPDATAQDADGNTFSADQAASIDTLTTGQKLTAILVGMFHTILTMDPTELGAKSAHGTSAQLMIVQDIQTAYETLGVGALPEAVRRPPGPAGLLPPVTSQPNPDDPDTPRCEDPEHTRGHSPPSWTQYLSQAVNIGAFHPKHAQQLACDSKLVGQIWNGHHDVLAQHRAKRLFTPAQRKAILARDQGCQTPGCTVPAVYCQIHHIIEWLNGGTTNVDNAITVCALHHAAIHNGKWDIRKHHGITYFQPAPWLDPTQPLLRNLYWNT